MPVARRPALRRRADRASAVGAVTSGTMNVRLERLQRAGLVEPAGTAADGRGRPVRLTVAGAARWQAATAERTAQEARLMTDALDPAELITLGRLLRKLAARVEAEARESG